MGLPIGTDSMSGQDRAELPASRSQDGLQVDRRKQALEITKEIGERSVRQAVPVGGEAAPLEDQGTTPHTARELRDQSRLSDAGFAPDHDDR